MADRMREARLVTAARRRVAITQAQMADLVTAELEGQRLFQAQWSLYERGESEPSLAVIRAAAKVSGLEPGYIAFGYVAPVPADKVTPDMLTPMPRPARVAEAPPSPPDAAPGVKRPHRGKG